MMSGNFFSCLKGVKDAFETQEGMRDFSRDLPAEKGHISLGGENLLVFLELLQVPLKLRRDLRDLLVWPQKGQSPCELRGASRDFSTVAPGSESSFGAEA